MLKLFNATSPQSLRKSARKFHVSGETGELSVDGVNIAYWQAGTGEKTIVFIHGNSACKEVFHHQFESHQINGYSLLALDLPGHGASSNAANPDAQYTIPGYALLIKRFLEKLEIRHPLIVGWSLGGHVALEMAGRGFDLAGALIAGTPPAGPGLADIGAAFLPAPFASVTTDENASEKEVRVYAENLYGILEPVPELFLNTALRTEACARRILGEQWGLGEEGCHQATVAAGWKKPLCVLHGREDPFVSLEYLQALSWRNLWREEVIVIENCGHAAFIEQPARFNDILMDFASEVFQ